MQTMHTMQTRKEKRLLTTERMLPAMHHRAWDPHLMQPADRHVLVLLRICDSLRIIARPHVHHHISQSPSQVWLLMVSQLNN